MLIFYITRSLRQWMALMFFSTIRPWCHSLILLPHLPQRRIDVVHPARLRSSLSALPVAGGHRSPPPFLIKPCALAAAATCASSMASMLLEVVHLTAPCGQSWVGSRQSRAVPGPTPGQPRQSPGSPGPTPDSPGQSRTNHRDSPGSPGQSRDQPPGQPLGSPGKSRDQPPGQP